MTIPAVFTFPAASTTAIATGQTTSGAGEILINGSLLDTAQFDQGGGRRAVMPGIQRVVTLTVAVANLSGVNVTIVGVDTRGQAVSETRQGPNNNTVATTAEYHIVTSITVDGAVGTAMSVGTGSTGSTRWFESDIWRNPFQMTVALAITATASVTVQDTPVDVEAGPPSSAAIFNHPVLAAVTASAESNYAYPARFVRAVMNSSSGSGAFTFYIIQAGN